MQSHITTIKQEKQIISEVIDKLLRSKIQLSDEILIDNDASLQEKYLIDSIKLMLLLIDLEDWFQISFSTEILMLDDIDSVNKLVKLVYDQIDISLLQNGSKNQDE